MRIGVLGSGSVGRTLAAAIVAAGEEVVLGTRDPEQTRGRDDFAAWQRGNEAIWLATLANAAGGAELIINATSGKSSVEALGTAGAEAIGNKILIDVANPLDFSNDTLRLTVCNDDSLAEQIQRAFPDARVVKTLNTINVGVMVDPTALAGGDHHLYLCGNDDVARGTVSGLLERWFGWQHIQDLGDLTAARGLEMMLPLWLRVASTLETSTFSFKIVR